MMAFDHSRGAFYRNAFDNIRIKRALGQKLNITEGLGLFFKDIYKLMAR